MPNKMLLSVTVLVRPMLVFRRGNEGIELVKIAMLKLAM